MATFNYTRLWADAGGVSHFEDVEAPLSDNGRGADLSEALPVSALTFLRRRMDYKTDWHPALRRHFVVYLNGGLKITASDGEERLFGAGSILLVEDTTGKGHKSQAAAGEDFTSLFVNLPS